MASSRSCKQAQRLNKSVWKVDSAISSSTLVESAHAFPMTRNVFDNHIPRSASSFLFPTEFADTGKNENCIEGWDLVEHPTCPPPYVEHWTRAMFIDATKR